MAREAINVGCWVTGSAEDASSDVILQKSEFTKKEEERTEANSIGSADPSKPNGTVSKGLALYVVPTPDNITKSKAVKRKCIKLCVPYERAKGRGK
jgi:hypothetical protein